MEHKPRPIREEILLLYSEKDHRACRDICTQLAPIKRDITVWSLQDIRCGDDPHNEVLEAIDRAYVIIPLFSAEFMADDFLTQTVVPKIDSLLTEHVQIRVLPLYLTPFDDAYTPFRLNHNVRPFNTPANAITLLKKSARQKLIAEFLLELRFPQLLPELLSAMDADIEAELERLRREGKFRSSEASPLTILGHILLLPVAIIGILVLISLLYEYADLRKWAEALKQHTTSPTQHHLQYDQSPPP